MDAALTNVVESLKGHPGVLAIVLFGSGARGETEQQSDRDLLVLRSETSDIRAVRARIKRATRLHRAPKMSALLMTQSQLEDELRERPSFVAHLKDEGRVLFEREDLPATTLLASIPEADAFALEREALERSQQVEQFSHPERFNGEYVPALAQLYAIGRSLVILELLKRHLHEYRWQQIFKLYGNVRPDLHESLVRIESLRPFYEHVRNRKALPKRQRPMDDGPLRDAVASLQLISRG